ncbi:hypothetical protein IW261DRAFT_1569773 [Armillaria novae-zelandiae]|uniref:Uncharacterized protein n=1 Tax=Armillaria novae-zelandiae TaxID=153914 RepID=A0AA39NXF7_9AGAR|nr:hypothetical protein IW261DRAFT_1569773 [Armillaria novae-zelandiae]
MVSVDSHLIPACDVPIDIDPTLVTHLERMQKLLVLRRLLGVAKRSPVATLFSETGMWPIRYRWIMLALRYWQMISSSWLSDLARDLSALHVPVHIDLSKPWSPVEMMSLRLWNGHVRGVPGNICKNFPLPTQI